MQCPSAVVLFPVWTSGTVICPICYQEFIPHRTSMETIVCFGLTHPELYSYGWCSQLSLHATKLSLSPICSATLCVWMTFMYWCFSSWSQTVTPIQTDTGGEGAEEEMMLRCYFFSVQCSLIFEPSLSVWSTKLSPGFDTKCLAAYLSKCTLPLSNLFSSHCFMSIPAAGI